METRTITPLENGIALLGASGRSGSAIAGLFAKNGISVAALYRKGSLGIDHPLVSVIQGDARDVGTLKELFRGKSAIVSALGQRRGQAPVFEDSARAIVQAARECGIRRYFGLTGLSLVLPGDPFVFPIRFRAFLLRALFPATLRDRDRGFQIIRESGLEWTVLRLPLIDPGLPARGYAIGNEKKHDTRIGTSDLAAAVLDILSGDKIAEQAPFVSGLE